MTGRDRVGIDVGRLEMERLMNEAITKEELFDPYPVIDLNVLFVTLEDIRRVLGERGREGNRTSKVCVGALKYAFEPEIN